mgnify:FL=1
MRRNKKLTVFRFADGLTFYGYIKKTSKDGWTADITKCDGLNVVGNMNDCFIEKEAVDVHFTVLRGEKSNG